MIKGVVKAHSSYLIVGDKAPESTPALSIQNYDEEKEFELSNKTNIIELMKNDVRVDDLQITDGGVAEIVKYNPNNQKMYLVSGQFKC